MIYLDHAATTPLQKEVLEKMTPYLTENFGNPDSTHAFGRRAMGGVDSARDTIAKTLGVKSNEVYFTSGGSESNTWAVLSAVKSQKEKGKHIVISSVEHHSLLNCAKSLEKDGVEVSYLPVDKNGVISLSALEKSVRKDTVLVAVMAANNEVGVLQPVAEISAIAKKAGALTYFDCVQTAGSHPLPVSQADMLGFSAHKFYGPKGVGALYIKNGTPVSPLVFGGEQERGKRGGTTNVAGVVGMAEAFRLAQKEREKNLSYVSSLRDRFESRLRSEIGNLAVNGENAPRLAGVSSVTFFSVKGTALLFRLDLKGIAVSLGSACASGSIGASHVLTAMGLSEEQALSSVRFSFGKENTVEEVDFTIDSLKEILKDLR